MNKIFDDKNLLGLSTFEDLDFLILIRFIMELVMSRLLLCYGLFFMAVGCID